MEAPVAGNEVALLPSPILQPAAALEVSTPTLPEEKPTDRGLSLLLFALKTRELSLIDKPLLMESSFELMELAWAELKDVRIDPMFIAEVRAFRIHADLSTVTSAFGRFAVGAGRLATIRPRARAKTQDASYPTRVRTIKTKPTARIKPVVTARPALPRAARAPRPPLRIRWGRVAFRGLSLGVIAAALVVLPPEQIGNVLNEASSTVAQVSSTIGSTIGEKLAEAQSGSGLTRATFEVPPLSAYSASFETQAAYPTATPNATVEWVVALRNTGSVGWYRGIDGAQASLTLADGTAAGVQTTAYVGPGQVGWFVVHFTAPAQPGVAKVSLLPRIDGRGQLPDLGIYAAVTVSPKP